LLYLAVVVVSLSRYTLILRLPPPPQFDGKTGKVVKTEMFGEKKANFNKSNMASNEIDQRIDENAKPANECVRF